MDTTIFTWIIYVIWFIIVVYLTVSAIGVKQETQGHLLQSVGIMLAIIAAFLLPRLPMFSFLNVASINPLIDSLGVILCEAWPSSSGRGILAETGARLSPSRKDMNL